MDDEPRIGLSIQWPNKMIDDRRKEPRQRLRYRAWIVLEGDQRRDCMFSDISYSGGRIDINDTTAIPDEFTLLLTNNGSTRRQCRVMWRNARQIGIKLDLDITAEEQSTLVPALNADTDPGADDAKTQTGSVKSV